MVFWNTKYKSFKEATKQPDGLAVLAVFLEEGETRKNELHLVCEGYQENVSHKHYYNETMKIGN